MHFFLAHGWLFVVPLTTEINFRLAARQVTFSEDFFYHLNVIRSKNKIYTHLLSCYLLNIMLIYAYGINGKKSTAASLPRHKRKQEQSTT